jgi:hypothetical protein
VIWRTRDVAKTASARGKANEKIVEHVSQTEEQVPKFPKMKKELIFFLR